MSTLRVLVLRLPAEQLRHRPALQLAIAWAHCLTHRPVQAREAVALLLGELGPAGPAAAAADEDTGCDSAEVLAEARVVEACVRIYRDDIEGVEALVQPCLAPNALFRPWVVAVASNVYTYVLLRRHAYEDAITLQALTLPFHARAEGPFSGVYGRCFGGMAARELGRLDEAVAYFRSAHESAVTCMGRHSHAARLAEALLGELLLEMNQLDEAGRLLEDSRALGVEGGVADFSIATYVGSSRLLAHLRDADAARAVLDEGEQACRHLGFARLRAAICSERVRHALLAADLPAAQRWLAQGGEAEAGLQANAGASPSQEHESLALAHSRVLLATGRAAKAEAVLQPVLSAAIEGRRLLLEVRVRILVALALDGVGRLDHALDMAATALRVGLGVGMRRSFLDEGARFIELTRLVQERVLGHHMPQSHWSAAALAALADVVMQGRTVHAPAEASAAEGRPALAPPPLALGGLPASLKLRESEILQLLERGLSNKEIARRLDIGVDTVKWYLKSIYGKLGVANRAQAVLAVREQGEK